MNLLSRLREALLPEYEVEKEIASGGMGTVFLARETALDRTVAIKIIRPELATARAVDRFLTEARTLARLAHPNIVPVHHVGEAGGFEFYVMEYMTGETLADHLRGGPLGVDEVRRLGRDLLDALEISHRNDVVHRDIKPQNVFLAEGRFVLGDFGIASTSQRTPPGDGADVVVGTPRYMPPEQRYGWDVGPRTDLYGVGLVLYEALTGRQWAWFLPDDRPDWSGVPRTSGLRAVLRRALAFRPGDRWPDARSFRHALWRTRVRRYAGRTVALTAAGLVAGAAVVWMVKPSGIPIARLAITEFQVVPPVSPDDGFGLANLIQLNLQDYGRRIDSLIVRGLVEDDPATEDPGQALAALHANAYLRGVVRRLGDGDSLEARLQFVRKGGDVRDVPVAGSDQPAMACKVGREIVRLLQLPVVPYECSPRIANIPARAIAYFNEGEAAFRQQAWGDAEDRYRQALNVDPTFALARWRLLNDKRWQRNAPFDSLLDAAADLYVRHRDELLEADQHLLEAWLMPRLSDRIAKYREAVEDLPRDPFTWLVYGDDLFMRGALAGIPLERARAVLDTAVDIDSLLGPALMDLTWEAVRSGDSTAAWSWLTRLLEAANPDQSPIPPQYFQLTYTLRFRTEEQRTAALTGFLGGLQRNGAPDTDFSTFLSAFRFGASFGLAADQAAIASTLLKQPDLPDPVRLILLEARGLGLFGTGRYQAALADFDSVAALYSLPQAALQAAQWRVLPSALDLLPDVPDSVVEDGRSRLRQLTADAAVGNRARWSLAVDAYARGDVRSALDLVAEIRATGDSAATDLLTFLEALQRAAEGDVATALALTDTLVPYEAPRATEPFLRTAIYLMRGRWSRVLDQDAIPDAWIWYLNADITDWPGDPNPLAQAGEIDWAVGPIVRLLRAHALLRPRSWWHFDADRRREACGELDNVAEVWRDPDPVFAPLRHDADSLYAERCR